MVKTTSDLVWRKSLLKIKPRKIKPQSQMIFQIPASGHLKKTRKQGNSWKSTMKLYTGSPFFFILGKNTAGYEIVNQLNILLQSLADRKNRSNVSMIAVMDLLHLVLAKTEISNDSSIAKTISRRKSQWKKADIENLFNQSKALQCMLSKNSNKINETKQLSNIMISSAIGLLTEYHSRSVLSLNDTIDSKSVENS